MMYLIKLDCCVCVCFNKAMLMSPVRFMIEILVEILTLHDLPKLLLLSELHEIFNTEVTHLTVSFFLPVIKDFSIKGFSIKFQKMVNGIFLYIQRHVPLNEKVTLVLY